MLREIAAVKDEVKRHPPPQNPWRGLLPWWPDGRS
jgi:hypothetical protein